MKHSIVTLNFAMSLCTAIDFQLEDFLTNSAGLGLNLSTNNGLDLTCPNYEEGLNLSNQQTGQGGGNSNNHGSGHQQQFNYNDSMVLNLTQVKIIEAFKKQQKLKILWDNFSSLLATNTLLSCSIRIEITKPWVKVTYIFCNSHKIIRLTFPMVRANLKLG